MTCRYCGAPLERVRGRKQRLYCSRDCYHAARSAGEVFVKSEGRPPEMVTCEHCGNQFDRRDKFGKLDKDKRFCNRKCSSESRKLPKERLKRTCEWCDDEFYAAPTQLRQRFCCPQCATVARIMRPEGY